MELDSRRCYAALKSRDSRCDGSFFVAVSTTRIYCRPVCTARTPGRGSNRGAMNEGDLERLAAEYGLSSRQLRRVLESEFGVTPVELAQTRRLLWRAYAAHHLWASS